MPKIDLEKDREKLEKYQADSLIGQLGAVQLHLEDIYSGKEAALCQSCLGEKHIPTIEVLATECLGVCRLGSLWEDIARWARDFKENKVSSQYLGKGKKETLDLRNQARAFRKRLGEITKLPNNNNPTGGNKMSEHLAIPETKKPVNQITKKRGSLWPWLVLAVGGGTLYYFHGKKKTAEAQALARASEAQLQAQTQPAEGKGRSRDNHPGLRVTEEEHFSADDRFEAMGEDPEGGTSPLARENYKRF